MGLIFILAVAAYDSSVTQPFMTKEEKVALLEEGKLQLEKTPEAALLFEEEKEWKEAA